MNWKQKLILTIAVPLIIVFAAIGISSNIARYGTGFGEPLNLEETWYIWVIAIFASGMFIYRIYSDKKTRKK